MEIKQITDIHKALEILWEYDKANQMINFPKDKPDYELFKKSMIESYKENSSGFLFIYNDNKKIVGSMILRIKFNLYRQQKYGEVWYIYFDASCRGKGYGTKALEYADKYFKENDCEFALAGISAINSASNAIFDKLGYKRTRSILEKQY